MNVVRTTHNTQIFREFMDQNVAYPDPSAGFGLEPLRLAGSATRSRSSSFSSISASTKSLTRWPVSAQWLLILSNVDPRRLMS